METKHTPTPWSTDAERNASRTMIYCDTEYLQGQLIAMSPINTMDNIEQHKADMEHIVKCVNSHEKLVEALSVFYHNSLVSNDNPIKESLMVEAQEKARQALKSAGEI